MGPTTVIYEGTPGIRLHTASLEVVGIVGEELEHSVRHALDRGASRIELCGGMGTAQAVRAQEVVAGRVPLGHLRYGFESLELIADYKRAFAAGEVRPSAFLYPGAEGAETVEHPDVTILPVRELAHAEQLGARFAREGTGLVELYGGLGADTAAAVLRGAGDAVPVGFVDH